MKEYIIDIVWKDEKYNGDDCIQGLFDSIDDAIDALKETMNIDDIDYYIISENTVQGVDEVYDSRK